MKQNMKISDVIVNSKKDLKISNALEDLKKNHSWSWANEVYERNKNNVNKEALFYRGNSISFLKFFKNVIMAYETFLKIGIKKNDKIALCLSNSPELIYVLMALNLIGARANIFGSDFSPDYIEEILSNCSSKLFMASDDNYSSIHSIAEKFQFQNKVIISLTNSIVPLADNEYKIDKQFYEFENKVSCFQKNDSSIIDYKDFVEESQATYDSLDDFQLPYYFEQIFNLCKENTAISDEFTITYTSGSTRNGRPKAIVHTNRSYITMARFHDPDLSPTPPIKDLRGLAHIPPHSNTDLITSISDMLCQGCSVALEPIYNKDFFPYALLINEPNLAPATKSFFVQMIKSFHDKEDLKGKKLPFLMVPISVGEPTVSNEEKFINQGLRELKAGIDMLPFHLAPVTLSLGGGDVEHGGLFFILYKATQEFIKKPILMKEEQGYVPFLHVETVILNKENQKCKPYELGRLAANSDCTMLRYENNVEATKNFFITDKDGKKWGDSKVWAYYDKQNCVHIKGRYEDTILLENQEEYPLFLINDIILKDTKNILSCDTIKVEKEDQTFLVAHIELQPNKKSGEYRIWKQLYDRIHKYLPEEILKKLVFKKRYYESSYPLTGCGKRNNIALENEGLNQSFQIVPNRKQSAITFVPLKKQEESYKVLRKTL